MSGFDPNYKRLKIIIVLFVFLTGMYLLEWSCFVWYPSINQDAPIYMIDPETGERIEITDEYFENESMVQMVGGTDFNFFGFMTFTLDEIPEWQRLVFAPLSIIIWLVALYLVIDMIYAWIKALPFT